MVPHPGNGPRVPRRMRGQLLCPPVSRAGDATSTRQVAKGVKRCLTTWMLEWVTDQRRLVWMAALASGAAVTALADVPCGITTAVGVLTAAALWWWVTPVLSQQLTRWVCRLRHVTGPPLPVRSDSRRAGHPVGVHGNLR